MIHWLLHLYSQDSFHHLIATGGLLALIGIIFAETGLFLGFFLPGDSLLLTTGVCCRIDPLRIDGPPLLDFTTTAICLVLAAAIGNVLNFHLGRLTGSTIRRRPDGLLFKRKYLVEAEAFHQQWGALAVIAGRFVPIIRTFVPFVAGMSGMGWLLFLAWSGLGAVLWIMTMLGLGYWLAHSQTLVKQLHLLVLLIVAMSFVPIGIGLLRRYLKAPALVP